MIDLLRTVDQSDFNMQYYYGDFSSSKEKILATVINNNNICGSPACIIGHSVVLDKKLFIKKAKYSDVPSVIYRECGADFTGLDSASEEWMFCFSGGLTGIDNTVNGAINRLESLINGTWKEHEHYIKFFNK